MRACMVALASEQTQGWVRKYGSSKGDLKRVKSLEADLLGGCRRGRWERQQAVHSGLKGTVFRTLLDASSKDRYSQRTPAR